MSVEKYPIAVTAVIFNSKDEFLMLKSQRAEVWVLPGGGMEKDEDVMGCLRRELREELGDEVQVEILGIAVGCSFTLLQALAVGLTFVGTYLGGEITLSDEHEACRWLHLTEMEKEHISQPYGMDIFRRAAKLYPFLVQIEQEEGRI